MAAVLALLAAVGWGSSDYAAGSASRRSSAISVVVLTHATAFVVLLCVAIDVGPLWTSLVELAHPNRTGPVTLAWPRLAGTPTMPDLAWGITAGLGGGFGAMLLFRGLGRGSMAVVAPITAAGAASVPVLFGVATGESLATTGVAGIVLALAAIVLVSLSPATDDTTDDAGDDTTGTGDDGQELTVPEGWVEEFGGFADAAPLPLPAADDLIFPGPAPASPTGAVGTAYATRVETAPAIDEPAVAAFATEFGVTVRSVVGAMLTLIAALCIAAAGIAAAPITDLVAGERPSAGHLVLLGFALATVAVALSGLRYAKPLLALAAPGIAAPGGAATAAPARTAQPAWRRILAQPGLPEALLSGVGFGTFYVCISRADAAAGHWPMVSARGVSVLLFTIVALATTTPVLPERGTRRFVVLAGVLDAAAAVLFVLATNAGLLSIGAVLASLYPAVTVLLSRWHGKERIAGRQFVGLALALGAVGLLAA